MYTISNEYLSASINAMGAELSALTRTDLNINYLWNGDHRWWAKHSPILFPIVGTLKNNTYRYKEKEYKLPRHGFAREKNFSVLVQSGSSISFSLKEDASTLEVYPFPFLLVIKYTLQEKKIFVSYHVTNSGDSDMFFSIGAHPAFSVPLIENSLYEDYFLEFSENETLSRYGLSDGLLNHEPVGFLINEKKIPLSASLFVTDAIVLKHPVSETISLRGNHTSHGFTFSIKDWPHLGIWAAANAAPFVCIEPWQGHADTVDHDGELENKPGIVLLPPGRSWSNEWWVELF